MGMTQADKSKEQIQINAIPGGILYCLNDAWFTILEVNEGFVKLFGYTAQELEAHFHNRFIEMIHPADREWVLGEVKRQIQAGPSLEVTYRVRCKDGQYKWVLDNDKLIRCDDGPDRFLCVMLDVTEAREAREELRLSLERHRIIIDQATDIIFEWDIAKDTLLYAANWEKKFGYTPQHERITPHLLSTGHIHPDDRETFTELMEAARGGTPYVSAEVRIRHADGRFIWCRIRASAQYDDAGRPFKTVGVILDIDQEKHLIDDLRQRAERDALTGLYNRKETEAHIQRHLEQYPDEGFALLMIDTDNFKQVNNTKGHLFGDAVLTEMASGMKKLIRSDDIIGRIGGDEFLIYLRGMSSPELVARKAERLLEMFRHLFEDDKQLVEVTCSVGAVLYPRHGRDFQTLYSYADQALYKAKRQGKNQFVLFDGDESVALENIGYSSLGAEIESDGQALGTSGELVDYVFQILYDTQDLEEAIGLILKIVGKRFDVSRAYIFENSEDGTYTRNTFEWCNKGITPEKDRLQRVLYSDLDHYEEQFDNKGIFYCRDISKLKPAQVAILEAQGICSLLQCAIYEAGEFRGFVGFDECTGLRLWTKEEIAILSLISRLLTIFLLKKRAQDHDRQTIVQLHTILDAQDAYIYVIEKDTFVLRYLNSKTTALDAGARCGMRCHQAFFGRETPCLHCPVKNLEHGSHSCEIYNPQYAVWTRAHATPLVWNDSGAYLIVCYDITAYKQSQNGEAVE